MIERVEINNDITRSEPIREVRQTKDARTSEATKKKFVAELERRLSPKKKKDAEKDEIILKDGENPDEEEDTKDKKKKKSMKKKNEGSVPSPDGLKGKEVDFLA